MSTPPASVPIDPAAVRPRVDDVAILLRTRTVGGQSSGGLGADTGPGDLTTFTDTTRPTATEVEAVIDVASDEVLGRLPATVDARYEAAIMRAVALRAAALIEVSFFRETAPTGFDEAVTSTLASLGAAVPSSPAIASGLSAREEDVHDALAGTPVPTVP